ncbi:RnfABCDGE type electron transport complex subunit G [Halanaerobium congolense]|jgi:electron transport complex protein RnfG|uniref:Ion-translocating oxidoreductase complex subunit G n=1 Tax=Halanaerobium congolense TaxID=54121 RepID=A0A318EC61_9FIRM|nr:RnfABCDGE type electron transport complex subunit G [Halanaerobium congolense]KXS48242.1 MAG: Electron transport complex protein RnfG [Halanaerobium sp. T82-1]PXV67572.1 electron transport complex protein RnfG [Halanaerobium congolense]TDP06715.1 electron transport complex protein RnfG [Halanaerobium congolense]
MEKNNMKNLILTLSIIGIVSALTLTFVYEWTTPYIQANQAAAQKKAINEVLPGVENVKEVEKNGDIFYEGFDANGNRVGVAFISSGGGYNGMIEIMIGVDLNEEKIYEFSVLNHAETPGLGARITEPQFKSNFEDKTFADYTVVKTPPQKETEVQAIAGATISSVSVTRIIGSGLDKVTAAYGGGN